MNKKEQQMQRERQEDVVLNKVLWWIVGAVVLEFLLLLLNRFYSYYTPDGIALAQALRTVFTVLGIVLPLCFLALLAWVSVAAPARTIFHPIRLCTVSTGVPV